MTDAQFEHLDKRLSQMLALIGLLLGAAAASAAADNDDVQIISNITDGMKHVFDCLPSSLTD